MSSSTSTSEPGSWRRALRRYLASCAILGIAVAATLIGFDPYDTGRLAVFRTYGVPASLGPRLPVARVPAAPAVEAAIVGNSTQLVDPARLGQATGTRFV